MPLVSIIVPVYNVEKYLTQCVSSIQNQSIKDIEIILVDDKSPDKSPQICDELATIDCRIKVIHKVNNEGLGMACNTGLENATGDYVAFCDSDDWVDTNMYESLYKWAIDTNSQAIFTGYVNVDDLGNKIGESIPKEEQILENADISSLLLDLIASKPSERYDHHTPMSAKTVLYKRNFLVQNGLKFESERELISEDVIWNCDVLSKATKVVIKPIAFYNYRVNPNSLTGKIRTDRLPFYIKLRKETIRRYNSGDNIKQLTERANREFIGYCRHYLRSIWKSNLVESQKKELTKSICNIDEWGEIYNTYPVKDMPLIHRIFLYLMKNRQYLLLQYLCKWI